MVSNNTLSVSGAAAASGKQRVNNTRIDATELIDSLIKDHQLESVGENHGLGSSNSI